MGNRHYDGASKKYTIKEAKVLFFAQRTSWLLLRICRSINFPHCARSPVHSDTLFFCFPHVPSCYADNSRETSNEFSLIDIALCSILRGDSWRYVAPCHNARGVPAIQTPRHILPSYPSALTTLRVMLCKFPFSTFKKTARRKESARKVSPVQRPMLATSRALICDAH